MRSFILALLLTTCCLPAAARQEWQRVAYDMDVTLHPDRHHLDGTQRLTYHNDAPDTLLQVFYHLYFNAFQPHSMMAERNRHLPDPDGRIVPRIFELGPDEVGYHHIEDLRQDGRPVAFDIHDTVMRVTLDHPIPPGGTSVFTLRFRSQVPLQTRRSGRDNREGIAYSMSQWYPKMAAYDRRGWHPDPYVGREFYAPYATFDVRLTLPAGFVVGATGALQNPEAVGHGYAGTPTPDADTLTWHFVAHHVHDFAWVADPDYLHDRIETPDGVTIHLLYQPDVAEAWRPMRQWVPAIIAYYSRRFGPYPYPQFTVAQAGDGGMEYPMMNFITGRRSPRSLLGVTAHEAAHEWFYGILGSDETDYAWMDEGFTSFAAAEAVAALTGTTPSHAGAVNRIVAAQLLGFADRLNTRSDWFRRNAAYGTAAYSGGEMIADLLGYVLSDSLRDEWLRAYYRRFRFRHPTPFDVEKVAEDVSGLRLDWFFEQFLNTTRRLDYAVEGLASTRHGDGWRTTLTLARRGDVAMPVDVRLTLSDGSFRWVTIPLLIMEGHKPVPPDWIVGEAWPWTFPVHTLSLDLPQRVVRAEIDPLGRTPDVNRLNNRNGLPVSISFLRAPAPEPAHYSLGIRPLVQYAYDFGVAAGVQATGTYTFGRHQLRAMVKLWPEVLFSGGDTPDRELPPGRSSALDGLDYAFAYAHPVTALGPGATASATARKHLGILENEVAVSKAFGGPAAQHTLTVAFMHQYRSSTRAFRSATLPGAAPAFPDVHFGAARARYRFVRGGTRAEVLLELGGALEADPARPGLNANRLSVDVTETLRLGRFPATYRLHMGFGARSLADHKRFRLGVASFEERWRDDAFRTLAAAFSAPLDDAHLVAFDGAGPVAYQLSRSTFRGETILLGTRPGRNLFAGRLALGSGPLSDAPLLRPLGLEAFFGYGITWDEGSLGDAFQALIADAGVGVAYDVAALPALRRWTAQSTVLSGLRLVARFPLWASDPDLIAPDEPALKVRWLVGLELR